MSVNFNLNVDSKSQTRNFFFYSLLILEIDSMITTKKNEYTIFIIRNYITKFEFEKADDYAIYSCDFSFTNNERLLYHRF